MTKNAERLVTSNTLAALTKYPVLDNLWKKKMKLAYRMFIWLAGLT